MEPVLVEPPVLRRYGTVGAKGCVDPVELLRQSDQDSWHHEGLELGPHSEQSLEPINCVTSRQEAASLLPPSPLQIGLWLLHQP